MTVNQKVLPEPFLEVKVIFFKISIVPVGFPNVGMHFLLLLFLFLKSVNLFCIGKCHLHNLLRSDFL